MKNKLVLVTDFFLLVSVTFKPKSNETIFLRFLTPFEMTTVCRGLGLEYGGEAAILQPLLTAQCCHFERKREISQ